MNSANSMVAKIFGRIPFPLWQRAVLFSVAYLVCAEAGSFLSVRSNLYVSFWLPAGLYVAELLLNARRAWGGLVLAAFSANLLFVLFPGTEFVIIPPFYFRHLVPAGTAGRVGGGV